MKPRNTEGRVRAAKAAAPTSDEALSPNDDVDEVLLPNDEILALAEDLLADGGDW